MKLIKTSLVAVSMVGALAASQSVAAVEVEASVGVASTYLFRGGDLGEAAIYGDVTVSHGGAYASVWTSSGDENLGQEYDLILGYGNEVAGFSYDVNLVNFIYPNDAEDGVTEASEFGDYTELTLGVGYGPVSASYTKPVTGSHGGYEYITLGAEHGKVSGLVGISSDDSGSSDYTHLDVSYAYSDRLSFTASQVVDNDDDSAEDNLNLVVSYDLPIK